MTSHIDSDTGTDTGMTPTVTLQALAAAGGQPGWRVLDTARTQQFTGEITFQDQPSISVYFDGGVAYHAVRAGDPSLCARLVDAGVVEPAQVERGVIRVGNVENLGRLFDRDSSIDRDAVMVVLELATDDVVTAIANTVSGSFALTAYRHHVSGVHRWFVSPGGAGEQRAQLTPVGEVAQIDGSVTGDLPGIAGASGCDDVRIEWNQPIPDEPEALSTINAFDDDLLSRLVGEIDERASMDAPPTIAAPVDDDIQIEWNQTISNEPEALPTIHAFDEDLLARLVGDLDQRASMDAPTVAPATIEEAPSTFAAPAVEPEPTLDLAPTADPVAPPVPPSVGQHHDFAAPAQGVPVAPALVNDDFQIRWPDGSEQHLADIDVSITADSAEPPFEEAPLETPFAAPTTPVDDVAVAGAADDVAVDSPAAVQPEAAAAPSSLSFDMPSLALTADNEPDEQQPEQVVDAVRRALEAIEAASTGTAQLPSVAVGPAPAFQPAAALEFDIVDLPAREPAAATTVTSIPAAPGVLSGFAAPTMNDSAEAVYARSAAIEQPVAGPASGIASVVFVDEAPDDADDRSGALKRLIGSLRRK